MTIFCEHSKLFGKVGEGIHSYRIFDIAILDVIVTIFFAYFIHKLFLKKYKFYQVLIGIFIIGIIAHRLFCVRSSVDKMLFT